MPNKRIFVRQKASPEGETKEQRLVCLSYLGRFFKYILVIDKCSGSMFNEGKKLSYLMNTHITINDITTVIFSASAELKHQLIKLAAEISISS